MTDGFTPPVPAVEPVQQPGCVDDLEGAGPEGEMLDNQAGASTPFVPDNEQIPSAVGNEQTEEERRQNRVLDTNMTNLRYIHRPLHELYCYLSVSEVLQLLAGECGLDMDQFNVYLSIIQINPTRLPAQVFLELYFRENNVTLRRFIQILMRMEEQEHKRLGEMIQSLLAAALEGNS